MRRIVQLLTSSHHRLSLNGSIKKTLTVVSTPAIEPIKGGGCL